MTKKQYHGSCLCEAVQFLVSKLNLDDLWFCHCSQCRKNYGMYGAFIGVLRKELKISGAENIQWYESSQNFRRGFCQKCGSGIFWENQEWKTTYLLLGLFEKKTERKVCTYVQKIRVAITVSVTRYRSLDRCLNKFYSQQQSEGKATVITCIKVCTHQLKKPRCNQGFFYLCPAPLLTRNCVLRCLSSLGIRISSIPCFSCASDSSIATSSGRSKVREKLPQNNSRWKYPSS